MRESALRGALYHAALTIAHRMSFTRVKTALLGLVVVFSGCYVPAPKQHATLHITAAGQYMLNDQPVSAAELPAAIAKVRGTAPLLVEIHASPTAGQPAVNTAVSAIKQSHALVAFAQE